MEQQQWRSIVRQLVVLGLLTVDSAGYGALQLSEKSRPLLRGETDLPLRRDLLVARKTKAAKRKTVDVADEDRELFEALRDCRKQIADENGVPPYVVFHDATLMQMAAEKPTSDEEFMEISGVGQTKLQRYGPAFLDVISRNRP